MTKCRKIKFNPYLTPLTKIDPKQIQGLNIRPDVIKLLEQNRKKAFYIGLGNDILDMTVKTETTKTKVNQWNYINL